MKKVNLILTFICGCLFGTVITFSAAAAYAGISGATPVNVLMDGVSASFEDVTGKKVSAFVLDGTTYAPVRGLANNFGASVDWDANSSTVILSTKDGDMTVYVSKSGSKYHIDETCGSGSYTATTLKEALKNGFTPCSRCAAK